MMFRMSTLSNVHASPLLRTTDWRRNRNASPKICRPRFRTIRAAARSSPSRRAFELADIATPMPATKRNSGAAKPPRTIDCRK